jgi:hypothetical protein
MTEPFDMQQAVEAFYNDFPDMRKCVFFVDRPGGKFYFDRGRGSIAHSLADWAPFIAQLGIADRIAAGQNPCCVYLPRKGISVVIINDAPVDPGMGKWFFDHECGHALENHLSPRSKDLSSAHQRESLADAYAALKCDGGADFIRRIAHVSNFTFIFSADHVTGRAVLAALDGHAAAASLSSLEKFRQAEKIAHADCYPRRDVDKLRRMGRAFRDMYLNTVKQKISFSAVAPEVSGKALRDLRLISVFSLSAAKREVAAGILSYSLDNAELSSQALQIIHKPAPLERLWPLNKKRTP